MEVIADPWFWFVGVLAVLLSGISKGGMGGGAGGVGTPLMSLAISPVAAAAVMLPVLCAMDIFGIRAYLWRWDRALLIRIVSAGLIGCVAGALTFSYVNENWIRILLGTIALGYLAWNLYPRKTAIATPSNRAGWFWCTLSGYTSFVTHAGSPPLMVYMIGLRLEKEVFIATSMVFFAAMNYAKILPYLWLGLFDSRNLATSLLLIPVGVAGIYLGFWAQRRVDPRWFYRVVQVLLGLTGSKLLYDGLTAL